MSTALKTAPPQISEWKVVQGGLVVGACILSGQALGFIRQATIAYLLGTGPNADAISVSFAPVDLWWAVCVTTVIFGYGPLMASRERSPSFADLARPVVRVAATATVVFLVFAPFLARMLGPGLPDATAATATSLLRVTALAIPAVSASTLFTALLYSERRFAFGAFHNGAVNICTIAAAFLLHHWVGAFGFAIGYAGGAWLQLAAAYLICRPILRGRSAGSGPTGFKALWSAPAYVLCYSLLIGLNPVVTRALASTFGSGATSAFDYCLKLVGVPLGLLVTPLSSSLLTEIAPFRLRQDRETAIGTIGRAAAVTALLSSVLVALMLALAPWVVALLFERGQFTANSTSTVTSILYGFYPVLIAWSVLDVISRSMFSLGKPRIPLIAAAIALTVNVTGSVFGSISSLRWAGLPAVLGFLMAAAAAATYLFRLASGKRGTS